MKQEGLKYFTDTNLTLLGLMIFFGYFVFMFIRVMRMKHKNIDHLSQIPFQSEDTN